MKNYLYFSRSEKIGILSLSSIVIVLLLINITLSRFRENQKLKTINLQNIQDFNISEIDSLENNIDNQSNIVEKKELSIKSMPKLPVQLVAPKDVHADDNNAIIYLSENSDTIKQKVETKPFRVIELNTADSLELLSLPGIGPIFASRIIKYRQMLGGYAVKQQLLEVYGFTQSKLDLIENMIIIDSSMILPINVNTATFKEILRHPYFDYETTLTIVNERDIALFTSIKDFSARIKIDNLLSLSYVCVNL